MAKDDVERARGPQKSPTKVPVSLRLSPEVVDHFKATGDGWQTRIDDALKAAIEKDEALGAAIKKTG
jgi:uncharacterized protein (DUF4415 family)